LVIGENGAGKSSMLDALTFALYGKPFRNINKPQLVNSINQKGLLTEAEFDIGKNQYLVRRGIKPNTFEIYKNNELIDQSSKTLEYQEILEKQILKMTYRSFCQVVILGNASYVPFMQLPAAARREIIEDLLDIQIFSTMNILLKEKTQRNKERDLDCDHRHTLTKEKYTMHKKHLEERNQDHSNRKNILVNKMSANEDFIEKAQKELVKLNNQLSSFREALPNVGKTEEKNLQLTKFDIKIKSQLSGVDKDIKFFNENDTCPTCTQVIDETFKSEMLNDREARKRKLRAGYQRLVNEKNKVERIKKKIDELSQKIHNVTLNIATTNQNISAWQKNIGDIQSELNDLERMHEADTIKDESSEYEKSLQLLDKEKKKIKEERIVLESASMLLKDSGVKSRIIKQYVPIINKLINSYLSAMGFFARFELNENFKEVIKSRHRDEFSYGSFSEGEKMRINLAILFTWRAIAKMRNSASTNLLIMDEVFDSSLDATGTEEFMKILNDLTENTNTFVISHKGDQLVDKFERVISFKKVKNFSQMNIIE